MPNEIRIPLPDSQREVEDWRIALQNSVGESIIASDINGTANEIVVTDEADGSVTISISSAYLPSNVLGTTDEIDVTNNLGVITLSLPGSIKLDSATASRLLATDGDKKTVSADLASWVTGTANEITVTDDGDGTITISQPDNVTIGGNLTVVGNTIIPNDGNIGSVGTNDAIKISNVGDVTLKEDLVISDGKTVGATSSVAGPILTFDHTNNYLEIAGGDVGIYETTPGANLQITVPTATDVGFKIKGAVSQSADLVNLNDSSDVSKFRVRAGGNLINTDGHITTSAQYGSAFWGWKYGDDTPEHTNQTGSYDHTGGAFERLFTKTAGDDFTQADEDNGNWILMTGINVGAVCEIKEYISATQVTVSGFGWDSDLASQTFQIFKHPTFATGDGDKTEFSTGTSKGNIICN